MTEQMIIRRARAQETTEMAENLDRRNQALLGTWGTSLSPSGNLYLESVVKEIVSKQWKDQLKGKFLRVALHFTCLIFTLENTDKKQRYWGQTLQQFIVPDPKCIHFRMPYQNLPNKPHPSGSDV